MRRWQQLLVFSSLFGLLLVFQNCSGELNSNSFNPVVASSQDQEPLPSSIPSDNAEKETTPPSSSNQEAATNSSEQNNGEIFKISQVSAQDIGQNEVDIYWELNDFGTGVVQFGTTSSYGRESKAQESFKYDIHRQTLTGLEANTLYHYRVISKNQDGELVTSIDRTFTTGSVPEPEVPVSGKPFSGPNLPPDCGGGWKLVSADKLGWMSDPIGGKSPANKRFSIGYAPDNTQAVEHSILKNQEIDPVGYDTKLMDVAKGYCAVMLRYKTFNEKNKFRTQPGKYMTIMAGRGVAGSGYQRPSSGIHGTEGWALASMSPVVGKAGLPETKNYIRSYIYSTNRADLGVSCKLEKNQCPADMKEGECAQFRSCHGHVYGDNDWTMATNQWITFDMVATMNSRNKTDGLASQYLDGKPIGLHRNIKWAENPDDAIGLWVRWRMMYGGTPSQLPPAYDFKEWFKDFELYVAYPQ